MSKPRKKTWGLRNGLQQSGAPREVWLRMLWEVQGASLPRTENRASKTEIQREKKATVDTKFIRCKEELIPKGNAGRHMVDWMLHVG